MKTLHNRNRSFLNITKCPRCLALFIIFVTVIVFYREEPRAGTSLTEARVIAVNDGDTVTIVMNGKKYRCRLIGMDAPEIGQEPWGEKAREHLRKILKALHWRVLIETDIEQLDKYNRLLIDMWTDDKKLINEQMLLDGYAVLFTIQPNSKYVNLFRKAQRLAREKEIGIWGPDGLTERPVDFKKTHPLISNKGN